MTPAEVFTVFVTVLILVDPFGLVPMYLSLAGELSPARQRRTIVKAVLTALFSLTAFILIGRQTLAVLGISPGSFFIAGGIIFFVISLDMILGHPQRTKTSKHDPELQDIAVFPLGVPILAGPGTFTTIVLHISEAENQFLMGSVLFVSVVLALAIAVVTMLTAELILRVLHRTGVQVIQRLMGMILCGLAVQFVYEGLQKLDIL